ncbi:hypothetical protein ACFSSB_06885 [Lacinutrix gracilariae]|uniref:asparagine synthase (glutamine-hydrolyzing) n=1 Tax=Lacinutrix gracilariae TaxID=1747198 RepID=A0ABW5K1X6_9FLAO
MNFVITNTSIDFNKAETLAIQIQEKSIGEYNVYTEKNAKVYENSEYVVCIRGYISDLSLPKEAVEKQIFSAVNKIVENWPVPDEITGSFTLVIFSKKDSKIIFCNDLIGVYPLYYSIKKESIIIASSTIFASLAEDIELDAVGITQRAIGKEFSNIGSRTILNGFRRLLPGEYISLKNKSFSIIKKYDNSLYKINTTKRKLTINNYKTFWSCYKKEVSYATAKFNKTYLALSGGMDSRLLLGTLSDNSNTTCLTYGNSESYEVKIAKRLATLKGFEFKNYSDLDLYFPSPKIIQKYTLKTEALNIASWLEILENYSQDKDAVILLGDMCEVLPARNIKTFSSRESRISNFFKTHVLNKDYNLTLANNATFISWKNAKIKKELQRYTKQKFAKLEVTIDYEDLIKKVTLDLEELLGRVEAHKLPYVELYDELYSWYTHARIPMGKQILICDSKFSAISPSMTIAVLRAASKIHPNNRLNYRFMNALFASNKELKKLNRIPTNQSPIIPRNFPSILVFAVWGIRSKIDQYLIRKVLKKKNPNLRYRLFKGLNWVKIYQNENIKERLNNYFNTNYLGEELVNNYKETILKRQSLEKWPLTNSDIISLASLNSELHLIKPLKKNKK